MIRVNPGKQMYPNWINSSLVSKSIFDEKFVKIGFSQNGEDEIIRDFFWNDILSNNKQNYLDIGCYNETFYSNTKLLNLAGWNGIAIDANPDAEGQWTTNRSKDTFLNLGVKSSECDPKKQTFKFYRFKDNAINTFDKSRAKLLASKGAPFRDIIDVRCKRLTEIAELILSIRPGFSPSFLNIDVERVDFLSDLADFLNSMSNPSLVCIEWISEGFGIDNYKESREFKILNNCNYKIINILGGNLFAAHGK